MKNLAFNILVMAFCLLMAHDVYSINKLNQCKDTLQMYKSHLEAVENSRVDDIARAEDAEAKFKEASRLIRELTGWNK